MRSNDRIPEDEMLLAEALSGAWAYGAEHATGWYWMAEGMTRAYEPEEVRGCCLVGALQLARDAVMARTIEVALYEDGLSAHRAIDASDGRSAFWSDDIDEDDGETLGHAYRLAMTQDESDPDTERLIRERSGK